MEKKLSFKTKFFYGIGDLGVSLTTASIQFFLLFYYTDVALIDPGTAGTAMLVGKLTWDAINDPLFGYLSDRTKSKFGRRRIYMLLGAIPFGISFWLMYSLPQGLKGLAAFLMVLGSFLLFDTFATLVGTPYNALSAELTYDYKERTSLIAVKEIFTVIGYILGAAVTTMVAGYFIDKLGWSDRQGYSGMGAVFGLVATVTILMTTFGVRNKAHRDETPSKLPPFKAILSTFKNKPFVRLLIVSTVVSISFTLLTSLLPYFLTYQLDMADQIPLVLIVMLGTIALFLVPWKWVADRINKGPSYALGLGIASIAIIITFFLPNRPTPLIYVIAFVAGLGLSTQYIFPWSMIPDVMEYDQLETGERREGIYYGIWAFMGKLTGALGIAASGWALDLFGYVPNVVQTDLARFGIRLFFGPVSVFLFIVVLPFLIWYPITKESHAAVVAQIEQMEEAKEGVIPLMEEE
jgi:GPH family glycoside/pentoside/hexuronide:cation symporter